MRERKAQLSAIIPVTGHGALPGVEIVQESALEGQETCRESMNCA
jgi:hypothetical protein